MSFCASNTVKLEKGWTHGLDQYGGEEDNETGLKFGNFEHRRASAFPANPSSNCYTARNGQAPNRKQQLLMSGFFEDDFDGDVLSNKGNKENDLKLSQEDDIAAPSTINLVSNMYLKNHSSSHKPKKAATECPSKGFTPNNRYK